MNTTIHQFILLIFNCQKYQYKAFKQKETWLQNFTSMPFFHVIGNPHLTTNYLFDIDQKFFFCQLHNCFLNFDQF